MLCEMNKIADNDCCKVDSHFTISIFNPNPPENYCIFIYTYICHNMLHIFVTYENPDIYENIFM